MVMCRDPGNPKFGQVPVSGPLTIVILSCAKVMKVIHIIPFLLCIPATPVLLAAAIQCGPEHVRDAIELDYLH